jgi:hypothetical protein
VTLSFGGKTFTGASTSGVVDACTGTQFPWNDGCDWTSAQRVTGSLASGTLRFTYGEAPKPGQNKSCAPSCTATGSVRVDAAPTASAKD